MKVDYRAIREDPALRRGIYGLGELTRYLNFDQALHRSASTVSRWAQRGLAEIEHQTRRSDYSFVDLISMLVVRNLVTLGLTLPEIRETEAYFRTRYGHKHPFVSVRLRTDGVDVFYEATPPMKEQLTAANRWGQEVLEPAITGALEGVSYVDEIAAYWSPIEGVVLDPTIQFGEPCLAETGITTSRLAAVARTEDVSAGELASMYRVDEDAVRLALDFEHRLAVAA